MNNFILLYGEVLDYPQQASIDKKGTEYYMAPEVIHG